MERFLGWFVPRTPVQDSCSLEPTWVALVWHPPSTALFDPHHVGGMGWWHQAAHQLPYLLVATFWAVLAPP